MLRLLRKKSGQSAAEYAILLGLVVAAITGMQIYVKRGVQSRTHDAAASYATGVGNDTGWSSVTTNPGIAMDDTKKGQFEPTWVESRQTQNLEEGQTKRELGTGGTSAITDKRITKQEVGDYQKQIYTPPK